MKNKSIMFLLLALIVIVNIVSIVIFKKIDIFAIISSITGVISVVLVAEGKPSSYYFGAISNITYVIVAINSHLYGPAILQGIFFLPMQFIGLYSWNKNLKENSNTVIVKKICIKKFIVYLLGAIVISLIYSIVLKFLNDKLPIISAFVTCFSLLAMYLTIRRYKEQWLFWIIVNVINITMWLLVLSSSIENSIIMAITCVIYLTNSIYGCINWNELEKEKE